MNLRPLLIWLLAPLLAHGQIVRNAAATDLHSPTAIGDVAPNTVTTTELIAYNTGLGTADYERGYMRWVGNVLYMGMENGGAGSQRGIVLGRLNSFDCITITPGGTTIIAGNLFASGVLLSNFIQNNGNNPLVLGTANAQALSFKTDETIRWNLSPTGHVLAATDNTYNIGDGAGHDPAIVFAKTAFRGPGAAITGNKTATGTATTTFTVTIGQTLSDATYEVNVTPTSLVAAAVFYVNNKTTTTFDVVYVAGLTGSVTFDYAVFP